MDKKTYLYISRWGELVGSPGLALLEYDTETGKIDFVDDLNTDTDFNGTCVDRNKGIIYIDNEVGRNPDYAAGGGGLIYAYKICPKSGRLEQISVTPSCCPCPAYLSIDPTGKYLICANHSGYNAITRAVQAEDGSWGMKIEYDDAIVDLFELNEDGSIGRLLDVVKHTGSAPGFMLHSRPHSAVWDPSGTFFVVCDKGDNRIYTYRIDYDRKKLVSAGEPYLAEHGRSPRYCAFHPDRPFFFNNYEGGLDISSYSVIGTEFEHISTISAVPADLPLPTGKLGRGQRPAQQAMVISADGRFIYDVITGKGIDGISVIEIDQESGELSLKQYIKADGKWARGIAIAPDGRSLVLASMDGDGIVQSFLIGDDGTLSPAGGRAELPGAAFVTFFTVDNT